MNMLKLSAFVAGYIFIIKSIMHSRLAWEMLEKKIFHFVYRVADIPLQGDAMLSLRGSSWLDAYVS